MDATLTQSGEGSENFCCAVFSLPRWSAEQGRAPPPPRLRSSSACVLFAPSHHPRMQSFGLWAAYPLLLCGLLSRVRYCLPLGSLCAECGVICFGPPAVQEWSHDAARRVGVWPVSCVRSSLRGPQVSLHTAHFSPETAHRP